MAKLPNLELLEFMSKNILVGVKEYCEAMKSCRNRFDVVSDVFIQMWGSTALGFGGVGGSAMTEAYTVVVHERITNIYVVFFDGRFCYVVSNPNKEFYSDLKNRNMADVTSAKTRYSNYNREPKGNTLTKADFGKNGSAIIRAVYVGNSCYLERGRIYNVGYDSKRDACVVRLRDNPTMTQGNCGIRFSLNTFVKEA